MDALAKDFIARTHILLNGHSGGEQQRAANVWLEKFKNTTQAWMICMQIIQFHCHDAIAMSIALHILRQKVENEWFLIHSEEQDMINSSILRFIEQAAISLSLTVSPQVSRFASMALASIMVRHPNTWKPTSALLVRIAIGDAGKMATKEGLEMALCVLSYIPHQLATITEKIEPMFDMFDREKRLVIRIVTSTFTYLPAMRRAALTCLENWGRGCISQCPSFGINAVDIYQQNILQVLFENCIDYDDDEMMMLANIISDAYSIDSNNCFVKDMCSEDLIPAIIQLMKVLIHVIQMSGSSQPAQPHLWRGIACILNSVVSHHSHMLFDKRLSEEKDCIATQVLELILLCTEYPDIDTAQSTLEFWYYVLDPSCQNDLQTTFRSNSSEGVYLMNLLSSAINAMLKQCRLPEALLNCTDEVSADHQSIYSIRSEVADTVSHMFQHWPVPFGFHDCLQYMADMLKTAHDIAQMEAILYLLERIYNLYERETNDQHTQNVHLSDISKILHECFQLPQQATIILGVLRYYKTVSANQSLPSDIHATAFAFFAHALHIPAVSCHVSPFLLSLSASIRSGISAADRQRIIHTLLRKSLVLYQANTNLNELGDILEALHQIAGDSDDHVFLSVLQEVLAPLKSQLTLQDLEGAARLLYLVGRSSAGILNAAKTIYIIEYFWRDAIEVMTRCQHSKTMIPYVFPFVQTCLSTLNEKYLKELCQMVSICLNGFIRSDSSHMNKCMANVFTSLASKGSLLCDFAMSTFQEILKDFTEKADHFLSDYQCNNLIENSPKIEKEHIFSREITIFYNLAHVVFDNSNPTISIALASKPNIIDQVLQLSCRILACDIEDLRPHEATCKFLTSSTWKRKFGIEHTSAVVGAFKAVDNDLISVLLTFLYPCRIGQNCIWDCLHHFLFSFNACTDIQRHFYSTSQLLASRALNSEYSSVLSGTVQAFAYTLFIQNTQPTRIQFRRKARELSKLLKGI